MYSFIGLCIMGMCMQRHACGDQILTCKIWASMWVSGVKFRSLGLMAGALTC